MLTIRHCKRQRVKERCETVKEINIATKIIQKRKEKRITQEELAAYVGVSKASVSKWETSQSYPDITILPILATYFDISIDELIGYSPQLTTEAITKIYQELTEIFMTKGYDTALKQCEEISKKYFNCYELQYYLGTLYMNYSLTAPTKELHDEMLHYVINVSKRIKAESEDTLLIQKTNCQEAAANLLLEQPIEVVDLLEDSITDIQTSEVVLASAYYMLGKHEKAVETLQFSCYYHMISLLQGLQSYIMLFINDSERFEEIKKRLLLVGECFQVDKLNTNTMAVIYLTLAQGYVQQGKLKEAMNMIHEYVSVCKLFEFPVTLKGDEFFDKLEEKFDSLKLMKIAPRAEKDIKKSIVSAVKDNPVFLPLYEEAEFQQAIKELEKI